jgi:hypothetical protein
VLSPEWNLAVEIERQNVFIPRPVFVVGLHYLGLSGPSRPRATAAAFFFVFAMQD